MRGFNVWLCALSFPGQGYLNGLVDVGRVAEAIKAYEDWKWPVSKDARPTVRRSCAIALRAQGRWKQAITEFQELVRLNIEFTKMAIGDLKPQASRAGADPITIAEVESLESHAVANYDRHDCPDDSTVNSIKKANRSAFLKQLSIK